MKIGIDCRELENEASGIGQYTRMLIESMSAREVELIQFGKDSGPKIFPQILWHIWVYLKCRKLDLIYHSPHSLIVPILLGKKAVLTVNDLVAVRHPEFQPAKVIVLYKFLLRLAVKRVSQIIVYSEFTKSDLLDFSNIPPEKIHVVPLFVTPPNIKPIRSVEPTVLTISTPEPRKNLERLIEAWSSYKKQQGAGELIIVGRNGWGGVNLKTICDNHNITDSVRILDTVSTLGKWQLLSEAWVSVYPSLYEGFGLPILEAMSMGVPVIAGDNSSLPEVMGEGGITVDVHNPAEICQALIKIISNPDLREQLSVEAGSQSQKFNRHNFSSATLKAYHVKN
ncbi:hypothetical protein A3A70_03090 [candidate division WWE3 bacterium RIFCSPLOWO2_01_FULL_42_11]|uniref:Glycosyl transferase family 1 domain-containing protein n=1 Tax=candidate division WWE3 bacterium RIFCSPLOWO2_01_FULL_42_11 TaxID=1802627 RepID=A0A1F4VRY5_UNCKA|nr:MAG: hypothetical protein A3A70_03090 [candidate division WWE3 bacterium RIFCSPLOWO2_01_FULL_42_11]